LTPFGDRDFERTSVPETDTDTTSERRMWEHDSELSRLLERPETPAVTRDTRRVVVRLHGGEDVELGRAEGRDPAVQMARDIVQTIEQAEGTGEWPLIGDRFLRPGAIVSIDVQRASF
jgi:hypothetical protein